jgi:hypothetical protein
MSTSTLIILATVLYAAFAVFTSRAGCQIDPNLSPFIFYARGGTLSFVFPTIYGGAIALADCVGWTIVKRSQSALHVVGVGLIVAGIGPTALARQELSLVEEGSWRLS